MQILSLSLVVPAVFLENKLHPWFRLQTENHKTWDGDLHTLKLVGANPSVVVGIAPFFLHDLWGHSFIYSSIAWKFVREERTDLVSVWQIVIEWLVGRLKEKLWAKSTSRWGVNGRRGGLWLCCFELCLGNILLQVMLIERLRIIMVACVS